MGNTNKIMHEILANMANVIELLDKLSDDKAFKQGEWKDFIVRSAAQAQALHGRMSYGFGNHPAWKTVENKSK